jgi:hypothetical protein
MTAHLSKRRAASIKGWLTRKRRNAVSRPEKYNADKDFGESINECYRDIRERMANGGPGWGEWPPNSSK